MMGKRRILTILLIGAIFVSFVSSGLLVGPLFNFARADPGNFTVDGDFLVGNGASGLIFS